MDPGKHIRTWQVHTGTFLANSHSLQQSLGQRLPKKKHDMFLSNNRVQVQSCKIALKFCVYMRIQPTTVSAFFQAWHLNTFLSL